MKFLKNSINLSASLLLITCMLILLPACINNKQEIEPLPSLETATVALTDAQLKNTKIKTGNIEQLMLSSTLKVNGSIDVPPQNMVSISIPLGGYLKSTKLLPGMHIQKGEVLAVMEDQQYIVLQQDYLIGKQKLYFLKEEYNRQEELNKTKAVSDKVLQQALVDLSTQKIIMKSYGEKLKLIGINPDSLNENNLSRSVNILSPIDGYVSHVNMNIGRYANPSDVLFELVNPEDIHLALNIFESDISKLFIGQKLICYSNANTNKKYPCEVILIGKDLSHDRRAEVHCHFEQYDKTLVPGMFMNAEIDVAASNAFAIPVDGLVSYEGKNYVFVQTTHNKFEMLEVTTLNSKNGYTQILFTDSINREHDVFVTNGAYALLMKMKNTDAE